jgi:hypothetical protein
LELLLIFHPSLYFQHKQLTSQTWLYDLDLPMCHICGSDAEKNNSNSDNGGG